jgi:hypothetical protein
MPTRRPKPKFSGALAEPIYVPNPGGLLALPEDEELRKARIGGQLRGKLELLLDHYRIDKTDPDCWFLLCLRLAVDFVPGMQIEDAPPLKPGRKRTWQAGLGNDLMLAVQKEQAERSGCSIKQTINYLRKHDPRWHPYSPGNLVTRLREAKRKDRRHQALMSQLLADSGPHISLADIALAYRRANPESLTGLFGLGAAGLNKPPTESDGNTEI